MANHAPLVTLPIIQSDALCLATLWHIARTDGVDFYFTDHSSSLVYLGNTYDPAGGGESSARDKTAGLRENNLDVRGVLDSAHITDGDLRAGKYRRARVTETLVDWRWPFAGAVLSSLYFIVEVSWAGQSWTAQISGWSTFLRRSIGGNYTKDCRYDVGNAQCKVDLGPLTITDAIATVVKPLRTITTTLTEADAWFNNGLLTWTGGNNSGLQQEVQQFRNTNGNLILRLESPFTMQIGDTFTVYPGCAKTPGVCKDKFNNKINYGGFEHIPGTDATLRVPTAKGKARRGL